jgi:Domain of unknown function (DUF4136)
MRKQPNVRLMLALGASLLLAIALGACYPNQPENLGDIGLALTFDNPNGDYSGLKYWAMEDTVHAIINENDDSSEPLNRRYDSLILETIAARMESKGFVRVYDPGFAAGDTFPDVVVQTGAVQSDAWIGYIYYGYPYYGYPGYGWGYPTTGYYKYTQGTILWTMADWRGIDEDNVDNPDNVTPILWIAGVNGALTGEGSGNPTQTIPTGINQCFSQSTYIQATSQ